MEEDQRFYDQYQYNYLPTYHHHYHPPNANRARGGGRKVGRKNHRNSVTLSFMLIHISTSNL